MGACHVDLGAAYLGAYPGVGACHSTEQNSYLDVYLGGYGSQEGVKLLIVVPGQRVSLSSYI